VAVRSDDRISAYAARRARGHVALSYQLYDDLRTGGIDAVRAYWTDDVVLIEAAELPDAGAFRGKDAVAARFQERMDLGFRYGMQIERADALDDERVYAAIVVQRSDMDLSFGYWQIVTWRDGLVVEIREYLDGDKAEQAVAELRPGAREP
jgi:ketosteroid isomerase-like protein